MRPVLYEARGKGLLSEILHCWIESVLLAPPAAAAPPSPLLCMQHSHANLTGYRRSLKACTRNWVSINCLHCNLCPVIPAPSCCLKSRSATLHEQGLKASMKTWIFKLFPLPLERVVDHSETVGSCTCIHYWLFDFTAANHNICLSVIICDVV